MYYLCFEDISSEPLFDSFLAKQPGKVGRPKRGRRRCMKGRGGGGGAGRTHPSQGKTLAVMNAISSHLDSPLASQLSDSSMIVEEEDKNDWFQHSADAPVLSGNFLIFLN